MAIYEDKEVFLVYYNNRVPWQRDILSIQATIYIINRTNNLVWDYWYGFHEKGFSNENFKKNRIN